MKNIIIVSVLLISSCGLRFGDYNAYQQNLALQRGELVKETKNKIYKCLGHTL